MHTYIPARHMVDHRRALCSASHPHRVSHPNILLAFLVGIVLRQYLEAVIFRVDLERHQVPV
eukprot:6580286-Prorocentrum_lima.AAC.1